MLQKHVDLIDCLEIELIDHVERIVLEEFEKWIDFINKLCEEYQGYGLITNNMDSDVLLNEHIKNEYIRLIIFYNFK